MVYDNIPKPPNLPEGWFVRFIRPGDEEGILRVLTEAFPRWPKLHCSVSPLEHLRWKLASHPVAERIHVVVDSPGGIVGARLDWGLEAMINDCIYTVRESIDRGVRPLFQHNHAMSAMRAYKQELHDASFDMYLGYSSDAPGLRNLLRYRVPATRYQRVLDVLVCDLGSAPPLVDRTVGWRIQAVDSFDERADALWSRAQSQFLFGVVRSSAHLNWRYADPRAGDYVVLAAEEDNRWLGYVVLRSSETTGYIADLLALPERNDVVESLLSAATGCLRTGGCRRIECWSEAHSVYRWALDNVGFRQPRRSIGLTFRPLRFPPEVAAFLGDPAASVLFSAGDTDLV